MHQKPKNDRITKVLSIISFTSIILVLIIIAKTPPASGYEISIYDVYPWYFWISILIPILIPFIALVLEKRTNPNVITYITVLGAIMALFVILSLPLFRGYPFYGAGDTPSYLGMIKDITSSFIGARNPYPIIHIWVYLFSQIINFTPESISLYIPQIFIFIYLLFIFLLSKVIKCNTTESLFIMVFSIVSILGSFATVEFISPSNESFYTLPMILFIFIKSRTSKLTFGYSIALVLFLILIPFFHPEISLFLIIILIILPFVFKFEDKSEIITYKRDPLIIIKRENFTPALMLFVGFFLWFSTTFAFSGTIKSVYNSIILNISPVNPPMIEFMNGTKIEFIDALEIIIRSYGSSLIYLIISGLISLSFLIKLILKRNISFRDFFLLSLFFTFVSLNFLFLIKGTPIGFHIYRQIKYSLFISNFIIGIYFTRQLLQVNKSRLNKVLFIVFIIVAIFFASILAVYNAYPSPSIQGLNYQYTDTDISGMNFFFKHRDENKPVIELLNRAYQSRFADYLLGYDSNKPSIRFGYSTDVLPPPHFGYNLTNNVGYFYSNSQYLLKYPPSEEYYPRIYPKYKNLWRYSPDDFKMLDLDFSVKHIYTNGNMEISVIN